MSQNKQERLNQIAALVTILAFFFAIFVYFVPNPKALFPNHPSATPVAKVTSSPTPTGAVYVVGPVSPTPTGAVYVVSADCPTPTPQAYSVVSADCPTPTQNSAGLIGSWAWVVVWALIIGLFTGISATFVMRGSGNGIIGDIVVGPIGALIGSFLMLLLGLGNFFGIAAFIGAGVFIALLRFFTNRRYEQ